MGLSQVGYLLHDPLAAHITDIGDDGREILVDIIVLVHHPLARVQVAPAIDGNGRQQGECLEFPRGGKPDDFPQALHVIPAHVGIGLDEVHRTGGVIHQVDGVTQIAVIRAFKAEIHLGQVRGIYSDTPNVRRSQMDIILCQYVFQAPLSPVPVLRPNGTMHGRIGAIEQLLQEMDANEAGHAGKQHMLGRCDLVRMDGSIESHSLG